MIAHHLKMHFNDIVYKTNMVKERASEMLVTEMSFDGTEIQLWRMEEKGNAYRVFVGKPEEKRPTSVREKII
jgi:hypothetical protein